MTPSKHLEVIEIYRDFFVRSGIDAIQHTHDLLCSNTESALSHCHAMLDKMVNFVRESRDGKVNRWLGFIQGCFWMSRKYTLNELMNHSRPESTPYLYKLLSGDTYYESSLRRGAPLFVLGGMLGFVVGKFI